MGTIHAISRGLLRGSVFPALTAACFLDYTLSGAGGSLRSRVAWLRRTALRHSRWFNIRIRIHGPVPAHGLIVANHISYLDIVGLSSGIGCAFIAKKEIAGWPLFGAYSRLGATIFVDRERKGDVAAVTHLMRAHLDAAIPLVLFPEGTSTDGSHVLPFRSSLLEPAVKLRCPVAPCGLSYSIEDGDVATDIAYWGDMSLAPHLLRMVTKRTVHLDIHFGPARTANADRKTLARDLHHEVRALAKLPAASPS